MQLSVLGPLEATSDGHAVERPSHRRLLAILVQAGEPLDLEQLAERFWPAERPATWKAALQTHVSAVRRILGSDAIVRDPGGYRLALADAELDLDAFHAAADRTRRAADEGSWEDAVEAADAALARWRGDPFPELADDEFAVADIVHLRERRLEVAERRARALLQLGRHEEALPELEALAVEHDLNEQVVELLMLARARSGRTAEALEAYRELRARMVELGLEPNPRLRALEGRILREDPTVVGRAARHNLPAARTSFVGREDELATLDGLVGAHRLVTLTGVGGTGKTRLALELARRHLDRFPDGVHLVELAAVSDPGSVASTVAVALGLKAQEDPADALREALRHRTALVVLDNCEHLLAAAAEVAELVLSSGRGTHVLATSRSALGLPDEARFAVPPLPVPGEEDTPEAALASPALVLLVDRARLATHELAASADRIPALAALCRRLDGLPLAIELAAARLGSISPEAVARKLTSSLDLLAGGDGRPDRHRAIEATIGWSHDLLTEPQRTLFARLGVFAGSFALEAAEEVCAGDDLDRDEVATALVGLVERSMVVTVRRPDGTLRYRLLETLRTFALERLADADPGVEELRYRHLAWAVGLAEGIAADLDRPDQLAVLDRLEVERDDLAAAHDLAVRMDDDDAAVPLAVALAFFWSKRGQYARAIAHLDEAVERTDETVDPERGAELRARVAGIHYSASHEADAIAQATHARDLLADRPPSAAKVRALTEHASLHMRIVQRDPEVAVASAEGAIEAAAAIGDRFAEAHALRTLGTALGRADREADGVDRLRDALAIARELDHPSELLGAYLSLFITLLELVEDHGEAMRVAEEAMAWLDRDGERLVGSSSLLMWISYGAVKAGRLPLATSALERSARYHLEGAMRMSYLAIRAQIAWTEDRLDDAAADLARLRELPATPRYLRIVYPLEAEVAALAGRGDDVHALARRHLAEDLREVERPLAAGTLWPAVRVEVERALASDGAAREPHVRRARRAAQRMRELVDRYPPSPPSGLRFEMPGAYLALAEAELTRLGDPDPDAWDAALERCAYLYWRVYARWRRAEALLATGDVDAGRAEARTAHGEAARLGAPQLLAPTRELAERDVSPTA